MPSLKFSHLQVWNLQNCNYFVISNEEEKGEVSVIKYPYQNYITETAV